MKGDVMGAVDLLSKAWQTLAGLITDSGTLLHSNTLYMLFFCLEQGI